MARWPGRIPAGRVVEQPVISLDLFPTALAASGEKVRDGVKLDGVNILPLMEGKDESKVHETLYWRFKPQWAIRDGDWKLEQGRDGVTHLFDLAKDPREKADLVKEKPDVAKRLQEKFDAWNKELMEPKWEGRQEGSRDAAMVDHQESMANAD
jgi:arylsulfatase A-like enzyme